MLASEHPHVLRDRDLHRAVATAHADDAIVAAAADTLEKRLGVEIEINC
jgi:hypothetical protein